MGYKTFNVLVISSKNAARSIMAEALFNSIENGMFKAYSAGSSPSYVVSRFALEEIKKIAITNKKLNPSKSLRSKSWQEFLQPDAPQIDFIIAVCDHVAIDICSAFHGSPVIGRWVLDDPSLVEGSFEQKKLAFQQVFLEIKSRIDALSKLPLAHLDKHLLKQELEQLA